MCFPLSWYLHVIALLKVFAIYGTWLALRNFFLYGACLLSASTKIFSIDSLLVISRLKSFLIWFDIWIFVISIVTFCR